MSKINDKFLLRSRIEKWIQALEGGGYKKGSDFLRKSDQFCCLGVLCDLYDKEVHPGDSQWREQGSHWTYLGMNRILPPIVRDWVKLKSTKGTIVEFSSALTMINDRSINFKEVVKEIKLGSCFLPDF